MASFKAKQPRANPPICWGCDRKLHGGGRFYVLVEGHPYHRQCAPRPAPLHDPDAARKLAVISGQWVS